MKSFQENSRLRSRATPVIMENSFGEWCAGVVVCALFFGFMWAYHDWWRNKPYTCATANEACALAGLYGIALAYAWGPLYRWNCLGMRLLRWRRPVAIVAVGFALIHMVLTFFPLSSKYGWSYFSKHWLTLVLGIVATLWLVILAVLSFRRAVESIGMRSWRRIQQWGVVLLPLILAHYIVLGKIGKWLEWFNGKDINPAPPGTLPAAVAIVLVLLVRGVDWTKQARELRTEEAG